ncbi:hypothetical protein N0V90_009387 [Kalmusia sp. IMI 367209]|nr:hypothetical protein N0V90_009387 [Kalmusia sp. IMI 367209]
MHFTVAASLLFAAFAAASPSSPIQERQANSVLATFYSSGGCNNPNDIIARQTLVQDTAPCHNITVGTGAPVGCTELTQSTLTRQIEVYDQPGCPETGGARHFVFPTPDGNNKFAQDVKSYRFI